MLNETGQMRIIYSYETLLSSIMRYRKFNTTGQIMKRINTKLFGIYKMNLISFILMYQKLITLII